MRYSILLILLLTNLVNGIGLASDLQDVCSDFGVPAAFTDSAGENNADTDSDPLESIACDHCCHGVAHYAGFVATNAAIPFDKPTLSASFQNAIYYRLASAPPTPPPNA